MRRVIHAAAVGIAAFAGTLFVGLLQGFIANTWIPTGALLFIAAAVGLVGAVIDAALFGKPAQRAQPADPTPAAAQAAARPSQARTALQEPAATAIVFRQQMPPGHDPRHLSYWGGVPTVPTGFAWPRWTHAGVSEPLHFLMQVDCAAMPDAARAAGFPARGVLAFFLDLRWGHSNGFRVIHIDDAAEALAPAAMPDDLAAAYGEEARYAWRWTEALDDPASRCPSLLPKWPFDPVAISIPPALIAAWRTETDPEQESPVFWWPDVEEMHRVLLEAQERDAAPAMAAQPEPSSMTRPYPNYPQDWRAVEIGAALLRAQAERRFRYASSDFRLRGLSAEERDAMQARIGLEAGQWLAEAAAQAPFDAVPEPRRDAFWTWLEGWEDFTRFVIKDAARLAIEAALAQSAEAAARIPDAAIDRVRAGHALATRSATGIFAVTPDRMLAPPSSVQGDQEETAQTHLLLLELSSSEGIGHHFGEGVYQFWITPEDLRGRRFERVRLTTSAY